MWQDLGYEVERYSLEDGIENPERVKEYVRIKGISEEAVAQFSKRRAEIIKMAEREGKDIANAKEMDLLADWTKEDKAEWLTPDQYLNGYEKDGKKFKGWKEQAAEVGLTEDHLKSLKRGHAVEKNLTLGEIAWKKELAGAVGQRRNELLKNKEQIIHAKDREIILEQVTNLEARFTEKDFELAALTYYAGTKFKADEVKGLFAKWENESESSLIRLPSGVYTTVEMIRSEHSFLESVKGGVGRSGEWRLDEKEVNRAILEFQERKGFKLTIEQQNALVKTATSASQVSIWQGKAGSGKTTAMENIKEPYEQKGFKVIGVAPSNKAASGLKEGAQLEEGRSVDSLLYQIETGKVKLDDKTVVILDEAGLCGVRNLEKLMKSLNGAKLIMCGDDQQLRPVAAGSALHEVMQLPEVVAEVHELKEVRRQKNALALDVANMLSRFDIDPENVKTQIDRMAEKGWIQTADTEKAARQRLFEAAFKVEQEWKEKPILCFKNSDVDLFNRSIQAERKKRGELGEAATVQIRAKSGMREQTFQSGDRIMFREKLGSGKEVLANKSEAGEIIEVSAARKGYDFKIRMDSGAIVDFNSNKFDRFDLGYAMTVHKSQGITANESLVYLTKQWSKDLGYVALSRMRERVQVFCSEDQKYFFQDIKPIEHKGFVLHELSEEQRQKILKPTVKEIDHGRAIDNQQQRNVHGGLSPAGRLAELGELQRRAVERSRATDGLRELSELSLDSRQWEKVFGPGLNKPLLISDDARLAVNAGVEVPAMGADQAQSARPGAEVKDTRLPPDLNAWKKKPEVSGPDNRLPPSLARPIKVETPGLEPDTRQPPSLAMPGPTSQESWEKMLAEKGVISQPKAPAERQPPSLARFPTPEELDRKIAEKQKDIERQQAEKIERERLDQERLKQREAEQQRMIERQKNFNNGVRPKTLSQVGQQLQNPPQKPTPEVKVQTRSRGRGLGI